MVLIVIYYYKELANLLLKPASSMFCLLGAFAVCRISIRKESLTSKQDKMHLRYIMGNEKLHSSQYFFVVVFKLTGFVLALI